MGAIRIVLKKEVITRTDGTAYLIRWHIAHTKWGRIMLHKIVRSDESCPHDHPWNFTSIMLWGHYLEFEYKGDDNGPHFVDCQVHRAPCILRRPANWLHKISVNKPCWTLVFTSTRKRKWGFWTLRGWVKYNDYTSKKICD